MVFLDTEQHFLLLDHSVLFVGFSRRFSLSWSSLIEFQIFVSLGFEVKLFKPTSLSCMYIINRTDPRTEPSRTSLATGAQSEVVIDDFPLFSIFYPVVNITIDSNLYDLEHYIIMKNFIKRLMKVNIYMISKEILGR